MGVVVVVEGWGFGVEVGRGGEMRVWVEGEIVK